MTSCATRSPWRNCTGERLTAICSGLRQDAASRQASRSTHSPIGVDQSAFLGERNEGRPAGRSRASGWFQRNSASKPTIGPAISRLRLVIELQFVRAPRASARSSCSARRSCSCDPSRPRRSGWRRVPRPWRGKARRRHCEAASRCRCRRPGTSLFRCSCRPAPCGHRNRCRRKPMRPADRPGRSRRRDSKLRCRSPSNSSPPARARKVPAAAICMRREMSSNTLSPAAWP